MNEINRPICKICNKYPCEIQEKKLGTYRKKCWSCRLNKGTKREEYNKVRKDTRDKLKNEIINHYGSRCCCCGESNKLFLTIDHINNDGAKQREKHGNGGRFYLWIKKNDYPKDLQILCFNCNCGRQLNDGICPHYQQKNIN